MSLLVQEVASFHIFEPLSIELDTNKIKRKSINKTRVRDEMGFSAFGHCNTQVHVYIHKLYTLKRQILGIRITLYESLR